MLDTTITGALIVDGTGGAGRIGDIGISDGRIIGVGDVSVDAAERIDGHGLVACPGFVDPHTHYDAQLFWDPTASPSGAHGVTTMIGGNCSFGLAPLAAGDADYSRRLLVLTGESSRRMAWRAMGIELDAVSASVLVLNLRGHPVLDAAADIGEPIRVTWRMLERCVPAVTDSVVWVCENPVVIDAAASRLGGCCRPIVCTDGMPNGVVWRLLAQLRQADVELRVHADFDVGGLRIAGAIIERTGAQPWRFNRANYEEALVRPSSALQGKPPATPWDVSLQTALTKHRRAIHEEALLDVLLSDLEPP